MSEINIIRPKIPQWSGSLLEQNVQRLMENPTYEQLEILQKNLEDQIGKGLVLDLFALLFKTVLDAMPAHLPLTPEQHIMLYGQIVTICLSFSAEWFDEFKLRMEEGFSV